MLAGREFEEADNPKIIDPGSWKAFCLRQQTDLPNYLMLRLTLQPGLPQMKTATCAHHSPAGHRVGLRLAVSHKRKTEARMA